MNSTLVLLLAALTADAESAPRSSIGTPSSIFAPVVRAQNPAAQYDPAPPAAGTASPATPPASEAYVVPSSPASPYLQDPFLGQPQPEGYGYLPDTGLGFGPVGPQPYRFGWSSRFDVGYLPDASTSRALGNFSILEANAAWRYTTGFPMGVPSLIFSWTPEFNYRGWSGPNLVNLPEHVYRFASDFELSTPANAPWSIQLGFTPAVVSDFDHTLNHDAYNWDGRGVLFYRASPTFMFAFGAAFWDRVHDRVIPYAGVIWTPNDRWEWRLMFPKARASYFLGNVWGAAAWLYGAVEYNVEAYQIGLRGPDTQYEKIEIADYRAVFGLRTEGGGVTGFVEAGWVFAREVNFLHGTPDFDIGTGFIGRLGLRF